VTNLRQWGADGTKPPHGESGGGRSERRSTGRELARLRDHPDSRVCGPISLL